MSVAQNGRGRYGARPRSGSPGEPRALPIEAARRRWARELSAGLAPANFLASLGLHGSLVALGLLALALARPDADPIATDDRLEGHLRLRAVGGHAHEAYQLPRIERLPLRHANAR